MTVSHSVETPFAPIAAFKPDAKLATLVLQDSSAFVGVSFGASNSVSGECVFVTGMSGYTETLTDPSYCGQILVLTYPLIGNYGIPDFTRDLNDLLLHFESDHIRISALVVAHYSFNFSHYLATSSLSDWLVKNSIPAIYGIDTRALTKKIRTGGVLLAKPTDTYQTPSDELARFPFLSTLSNVPFSDPNLLNLVEQVSTTRKKLYSPIPKVDNPLRIIAIDVGMKNNQIRCLLKRNVEVLVVPWDYDFSKESFDGVFVSNGPGDPTVLKSVIERLRILMEKKTHPIFGICLGHQLMALASGAKTIKLKFGNRGQNIPCTDMQTGRCYITSQNHGYAVDVSTLSENWKEYFCNANDGSNEGIINSVLPYFSVQFHPESSPGPLDTEYLFDKFITSVSDCKKAGKLVPLTQPAIPSTPTRHYPKKVLILGSGGLSIGQAALKEENIYTILINPNIATIQTSKGLADKVYFLPVNPEFVRKVILHEKPDGIYVTFGGQTALNVGVALKDEFKDLGVTVLGTPIETIEITEDRELFAQHMSLIGEKCAQSCSATTVNEAVSAGIKIGFPLIVRAAYTLGGLGSGFAENEKQLHDLCVKAFATSPQVLVEKSMKGWKEIEYEVVRDAFDNCVTNFDPLGIHTGDSIVVAPSQTLSDEDYMMLRRTAVNVIRHLGVIGECNIQYALNPNSKEYCIIEVNARLSRSSALASKATGYPLAFVAAKLGLGIALTEIKNAVTKKTIACFEPSLDYVVVKIPRWDLKKFSRVSTKISSAMKSVGEVMSIGRSFEETIQKAIRSVDYHFVGFSANEVEFNAAELDEELKNPSDQRLFAIANALHLGYSINKLFKLTNIDRWFLHKLKNIVDMEIELRTYSPQSIPRNRLIASKQCGFSDRQIGNATGTSELAIRTIRTNFGISPFVKQIDTVAAEFPCFTNYLYMTYNAMENDISFDERGIMVLGSGVYRIGSSVEFDWCAVKCIRTLREAKIKTIMVNYNPETVSTDYDEADRLYFENLTLETILDIYHIEQSSGVFVCMGGQTPNNVALPLFRENVKILGTSPEQIDNAENRYKFSRLLDKIGVDQPLWKELTSLEEARSFCEKVTFPVLVRPSYVLSGAAMNVVFSQADLKNYLELAATVSKDCPVVITKFIEEAKEIELDAVALNGKLLFHVISEHVENAGVHSGDATLILPPQDLDPQTVSKIEVATRKIAFALNITGPLNIQFIAKNNEIKVIECNVRASRSFPFCSKVLGVDLIEMATRAIVGLPVDPYPTLEIPSNYVAIKVPQFSFSRLLGADPIMGVEMASTGEVACFGKNKFEAYLKALIATGFKIPKKNILISIGSFKEKMEFLPSVKRLHQLGYKLFATTGTSDFIQEHDIPCKYLENLDDEFDNPQKKEYSLSQHLGNNLIDLYINLPSKNHYRRPASYMSRGYRSRRMAVDLAVPLITNIKCAKLFVEALAVSSNFDISSVDFQTCHKTVKLPGFVNVHSFFPNITDQDDTGFEEISKASLSVGFTLICNSPNSISGSIKDSSSMQIAKENCSLNAFCDYTLSFDASKENATTVASMKSDSAFLNVAFDSSSTTNLKSISDLTVHFKSWPVNSLIVANAKDANLATILLLSNLHNRPVHITNVTTREEIELIAMNKEHGGFATCDVCVYNMFVSRLEFDSSLLGTESDIEALWENLAAIDCFSVGSVPYNVAKNLGYDASNSIGIQESICLLLNAVYQGRMTLDDLSARVSNNPRRIFKLPEASDSYVEVELDRSQTMPIAKGKEWAPFGGKRMFGYVQRVVVCGETKFLDGQMFSENHGINVSESCHSVKPLSVSIETQRKPSTKMTTKHRESLPLVSPIGPKSESKIDTVDEVAENTSKDISKTGYIADVPKSITSFVSKSPFYRKHVLNVGQFSRSDLHILFGVAQELRTIIERQGSVNLLKGKVLCTAFYEPSTRTSSSFQAAMLRLGGSVVAINETTSSVAKGESLPDTIRTLNSYADAIVLRHPGLGSSSIASKHSTVPIINAGDGIGEHPTQAFLDIFTIREELGTVNGLTITIVGDLKNGRTVHSLVKILAMYDIKLNYVSDASLAMPKEIKDYLSAQGVVQSEYSTLEQVVGDSDVIYVTRIQKERFSNVQEYERLVGQYRITNALLQKAKRHMIVMHPLPRVDEIDVEVDFDQRAAYFRQMKYGLFVRMALLALVCGRSD